MRIPWLRLSVQVLKMLVTTIGMVLVILGISIIILHIYWVFFFGIGFIFAAQLLGFLTEGPA